MAEAELVLGGGQRGGDVGEGYYVNVPWLPPRSSQAMIELSDVRSVPLGAHVEARDVTCTLHSPQPQFRYRAIQSSPMGTQEGEIRGTARSATPISDSQPTQSIHATPIRHRGASSAAVSSSKWATVAKIQYVPRSGLCTPH